MIDRRSFAALLAGAVATPRTAWSQMTTSKAVFYASVGPALTRYQIGVEEAALTRQDTVMLPANVQYAWPHPSAPFLYVATSNGGSAALGIKGDKHFLSALRIDPGNGALQTHGPSATLPSRPIHVSLDRSGTFALIAYNNPSSVTVHRINADGTIGEEVKQAAVLDGGIFAHQIRTTPANDAAILVTRGNEATPTKAEDPGALKVFDFKNGTLTNEVSVAPNGGKEFGPRHLDFHPSKPWMYVSIETQNKMYMFRMENGRINPEIAYSAETLAEPILPRLNPLGPKRGRPWRPV